MSSSTPTAPPTVVERLKKIAQYVVFPLGGIALFYFTFRQSDVHEIKEVFKKVNLKWVFLALFSHLVNHVFRAYRWRSLIKVQGYKLSLFDAFLGEMSGFFMNLIPPRMGEWIRCLVLKRLRNIPISQSFAGVILERALDFFFFFLIFFFLLIVEGISGTSVFAKLRQKGIMRFGLQPGNYTPYYIGGAVLVVLLVVLYKLQGNLFKLAWRKMKKFGREVFGAIKQTRQGNIFGILLTSSFITFFHFMVEYLSFFAIKEVSVSWNGALWVFIAMNVGMALPTPGGVGTYHAGVIIILKIFGIDARYAIAYATLTHAIQLFNAVVVGGSSFLTATLMARRKRRRESDQVQPAMK